MATAEDIRELIRVAQEGLERDQRARTAAYQELEDAHERQTLRRELDEIRAQRETVRRATSAYQDTRAAVDRDRMGTIAISPTSGMNHHAASPEPSIADCYGGPQIVDCGGAVVKGEQEWRIEGMSWLENALGQFESDYAESDAFTVGGHKFDLVYCPKDHRFEHFHDDDTPGKGSLVVRPLANGTGTDGLVFRVSHV